MEPPSTPGTVGGDHHDPLGIPNERPGHEARMSRGDGEDDPSDSPVPSNATTSVAKDDEEKALEPNPRNGGGAEDTEKDGSGTTTAPAAAIETTTGAAQSVPEADEKEEEDNPGNEAERDTDDGELRGSIAPVGVSRNRSRTISADTIAEEKHDSTALSTEPQPPPTTPISASFSAPALTVPPFQYGDGSNNNNNNNNNNINTASNSNHTGENPNAQRIHQSSYEDNIKQSAISTKTSTTTTNNAKANVNTATPAKPKASASNTLAALFGGPSIGNAPGVYSKHNNNFHTPAAQHDYTLVGDSPYDTTYDPQSPYYYNRVFGQLYITTISVMFRGKAFGPIGAIPYERRLLLPFSEVSRIDAYKTTSIKITMNDYETYVFKSFDNRDDVVGLLRRTRKKCCDENPTIATDILDGNMFSDQHGIIDDSNITKNRSFDSSARNDSSSSISADGSQEDGREIRERRSRTPDRHYRMNDSNIQDVHRRSQSVPSSLRNQPQTAGAISNSSMTTPRQSSAFFDEKTETLKRNNNSSNSTTKSKTPKKSSSSTIPPQLVLPNTLRLSIYGDDDNEELLEEKKDSAGDSNRPRRLFELDTTSSSTTVAPFASVMLSPPRTTISQRLAPKTPGVVVMGNNNRNAGRKLPQERVHRNDRHHQTPRDRNPVATPFIPTVPSLDTPESQAQKQIINFESRAGRRTAMPLPIPEIANDESSPPSSDGSNAGVVRIAPFIFSPITPIANPSVPRKPNPPPHREQREQDTRLGGLWKSALRTNPKTQKDWQVALEPTKLANCNLDDWFDLFFSDDAVFSLARYQLEHVGDRDVSFRPWRRTPSNTPSFKSSGNAASEGGNDDEHDGVPELEREISYIHPIGNGKSMIGPSEAETFRVQSLKRYGSHGAILKNVTTVGKSIPMGDCFRVKDRWIIEQETPNSLKLSVDFRVVFVKRTMFKGIIQKNTLSETKEWFLGYSKMLRDALESPERQELQRRKQQQQIDLLGASVSLDVASLSSAQTLSTEDSGTKEAAAAPVESSSPRLDSLTTAISGVTASQKSDRNPCDNDHDDSATDAKEEETFVRTHSPGAPTTAAANTAAAPAATRFPVGLVVVAILVCLLLATVVALWVQVRSVGASLSQLEGGLGELRAQNLVLLQKLEELSVQASSSSGADPSTAGAILLQE